MTEPIDPKSTNREIAAALASHVGAPAFWPAASAAENARGILAYLRQGFPSAPAAQPATAAVDPSADDPLTTLTMSEREEVEKDPNLKKRFLAQVEAAEAVGREQRERASSLEEVYAAHDARARADSLAGRAVELRSKARGGQ